MTYENGFLVWITGLAGSGKSTLGKALQGALQQRRPIIYLDGDQLREVVGGVFGYCEEERRKCALFYSRLCSLLVSQGHGVICSTISMFHQVREENRACVENYFEVYLDADKSLLEIRDQKGLFTNPALAHKVSGRGLEFEAPRSPDVTFKMTATFSQPVDEMAALVLDGMRQKFGGSCNEF